MRCRVIFAALAGMLLATATLSLQGCVMAPEYSQQDDSGIIKIEYRTTEETNDDDAMLDCQQ